VTQKHQRLAKICPRSKKSRGARPEKFVGNVTDPDGGAQRGLD